MLQWQDGQSRTTFHFKIPQRTSFMSKCFHHTTNHQMIVTGCSVQNRYSVRNAVRVLEASLPNVDIFTQKSQTSKHITHLINDAQMWTLYSEFPNELYWFSVTLRHVRWAHQLHQFVKTGNLQLTAVRYRTAVLTDREYPRNAPSVRLRYLLFPRQLPQTGTMLNKY